MSKQNRAGSCLIYIMPLTFIILYLVELPELDKHIDSISSERPIKSIVTLIGDHTCGEVEPFSLKSVLKDLGHLDCRALQTAPARRDSLFT